MSPVDPFDDDVVLDLTDRPDTLELTLARAAYRDVLDVLADAAALHAIDDFLLR